MPDDLSSNPEAAHHRAGGGFQNPRPGERPHGFKDFLKWRFGGQRRTPVPTPPFGSLPSKRPAIITPRAATGHRAATWVGHSTLLMQLGPLNVLTDPIWSRRASPLRWIGPARFMPPAVHFEALPPIDVVLISHDHYDHLDAPTVRRLTRRTPDTIWLCPLGIAPLLRSWGARHVFERDWWQTVEMPAFTATCVPAQHFSGRGLGDRGDRLWCSWTIEADGLRVFYAGDTALHPEFTAIGERAGPFDLVLLPIGAYEPRWFMRAVHMDPEDAVIAYRQLAADRRPPCVAIHWGTFRLTDEPVDEPPVLFARRWRDAGLPATANWTLEHGETRVLFVGPRDTPGAD